MEMTAQNAIYLDAETGGKGRQFKCRFLVPGLVKYDYGVCLLTKENADRFIQGFVGCPVIINHHEVTDKNAKELSVGNIFSVWFDDKDGYYWCNGIINDKKAIELIEKGYSVSCQYTITEYADNNSGALHNGNPYDKIIENGKPEHLAIVNNPRYEGAIIAVNALLAENEDKWITIHPNGEDEKGRHLLIKEGETVHEAMERAYGIDASKGQQKLFDTTGDRKTKEDFKREAEEKQKKYDEIEKLHQDSEKKQAEEKEAQKEVEVKEEELITSPEDLKEVAEKKGVQKREVTPEDIGLKLDENEAVKRGLPKETVQKQIEKLQKGKEYRINNASRATFTGEYNKDGMPIFENYRGDKLEVSLTNQFDEIKETSESPFGEGVKAIEGKKALLGGKTSGYVKGDKGVSIEDFGDGNYKVNYYDGTRLKNIKYYSTEKGMQKAVRDHLQGGANKETKALETKTDLNAAQEKYNDILKKYNDAEHKKWQRGISNEEYHQAWEDSAKYKKELTTARREYAESIMSNFEEVEENPYEERQQARRDRYEELSEKAQKTSESYAKAGKDMFDVIPFGQPIHGQRDRNYRDKAWGKFESSWKEQKKSDYYADKAKSVGKAGISADDANAIAKLAQKYKSGVDSAEKRRIIDRVIDIHKNAQRALQGTQSEDYKDLGFAVERNADINRLQLKFEGKPSESVRSILKHNGFRWSPREGAWQRQLTGNAEYSLKRVAEELKANNSFVEEFKNTLYDVIAGGICERLGELLAQNKSNNPKEKWITIKGNHILLKDGENPADAFKRVTGVSFAKANKYQKKDTHKSSKEYKKILEEVKRSNSEKITSEQIIENAVKNSKLNEKEIREKIENADKYNEYIRQYKLDTQHRFSKDGKYTEERKEKHKKILLDIFKNAKKAKPKNGEKPTVIFLGGRGGSGKSKFDMPDEEHPGNIGIYDKSKYIVLDADEIKNSIDEYQGLNAYEVHEESSDILNQALLKAKKEGLNIVLDATMKTFSSTEKKVKSFDDAGYNIEMYYMHLPREKAAERAIGRFMGKRGRYVPLNVLLNDMKNNEENFDKLKHYASKWAFYNNDVPDVKDKPILIDKNY